VQVSLLGIEPRALFEFKVTGWLRAAPADAAPVLPEVARFPPDLLQCVYGTDEPETLCRDPALSAAELIHTKGGHHFDGNYQALARAILAGARRPANGNRPSVDRSLVGRSLVGRSLVGRSVVGTSIVARPVGGW